MKIVPFRTLEEYARQEYRKKYAEMPEPKIVNAHAVTTFTAPRSFVWGGIGYWAPPLSYEAGRDLLVAARAILVARRSGTPAVLADCVRTATRLIRNVVRPRSRVRRLFWRLTRDPFFGARSDAIEMLINGLLYVPDESPAPPSSEKQIKIDLIADLYTFRALYGCRPESWADYVYGMRHVGRHGARHDLRAAVSARVAYHADKAGWRDYERDQLAAAGWS